MKQLLSLIFLISIIDAAGQEWKGKFEQLGEMLPTPNTYRSSSGAPGPAYWQQRADYAIHVEVNDQNQALTGSETITYYNQAPEPLLFLWLQLDQNLFAKGSMTSRTVTTSIRDSVPAYLFASRNNITDYEGGYKITSVKEAGTKKDLPFLINYTMMRVDLPQPLKTGEKFSFSVDWSYNINDRMIVDGRGGMEFFPEDGNYSYTIAQWYPRMCVFDDYEGWQNKQFLGSGEFALTFCNYRVWITVPSDHIVGATGWLQNPREVLSREQIERFEKAQKTFDKPVFIVTEEEARKKEKQRSTKKSTWEFYAENVRDFAFVSSRKYIWDAMAVKIGDKNPLAQSLYPKEGNPLWSRESTKAIKNTLEVYSARTIDYPYPTAYSVHSARQGMEYPMICFNYGRPAKDGTYSNRTLDAMISVVVHEVGHNFFPMIVNSDERQWTWMDEGLNTFLEYIAEQQWENNYPSRRGEPKDITAFMTSEDQTPIMTSSDSVHQFGNSQYTKTATALNILRETVLGRELFDYAFREYARRWKFKRPMPADFFRTIEDASGVDLDWFWRGWFFTTDHTDVSIEGVRLF